MIESKTKYRQALYDAWMAGYNDKNRTFRTIVEVEPNANMDIVHRTIIKVEPILIDDAVIAAANAWINNAIDDEEDQIEK